MFDLDKPVIAAVNGMAVGGGFEIALCCDLIVADDHAQFFLPEVKVGVVPDGGGMFRLPRRVPESLALEMLMTGRRLSTDEALRLGLINHVTPKGGALAKAKEGEEITLGGVPAGDTEFRERFLIGYDRTRATSQASITLRATVE